MVADGRFSITQPIRATVATMLYPLQRALLMPVELIGDGATTWAGSRTRSPPSRRHAASWRACPSAPSAPSS
jgi:hypothetical protein